MKPDWQSDDGRIQLYCGDCLEIMPKLPEGSVDAVVTDPPFNFSTSSSGTKHTFWGDAVNSAYWFSAVFSQYVRAIRPDRKGFVWQFLNWKTFIPFQKAVWDAGLKIESLLVWDKQWIGPGGPLGLRPSYELVGLISINGAALPNRGLTDIWPFQWSAIKPNGHPAEKPVALIEKIVNETPGQTIFDPFMGSGTTGIACIRTNRRFIGIEIDEKYFQIAVERIERELQQTRLF